MLNTKSFLTVDFGAGSLKLAEFEINESGGLCLKNFAIKPLGPEGALESTREKIILAALQEVIAEKGITAKNLNVCAPGFHVFPAPDTPQCQLLPCIAMLIFSHAHTSFWSY